MIRMISGYTSVKSRLIGPNDGPVELPEDVEQRLVALGAAEYATDSPAAPTGGDSTDNEGVSPAAAEIGAEAATEGVTAQYEPGEAEICTEDMTFAQLKAAAEQMGIETKGMRSKAALISAIENAKPPNLKVME